MNNLQLHTRTTDASIHVFWKTGMETKGGFEVTMPSMPDADIAAELAVARLLLEEHNACGHDKTGAGLCLEVTFGGIRRLLRHDSTKTHLVPYAMFLRTRFIGARIEVVKRPDWVSEVNGAAERLTVDAPAPTMIEIGGIGPVELTTHAFDQYLERFEPDPASRKIWRRLVAITREAKPVAITNRSAFHDAKHRREGKFAWNQAKDCMLVVVPPDNKIGGAPRLATIYRPSEKAKRGAVLATP